jgi:hypothetical protein
MPMLSMLETIFYKIMQRVETKQREAEKMSGTICPKIRKKIDKFTEWSLGASVKASGNGIYHVKTGEHEKHFTVDFPTRSCDCRRWQLSGIPCHHAIACCRVDRIDVETLVHSCYSIQTYQEAYRYNLVPLRGRVLWEKMNGVHVLPPLYTKVMGRPRKNRKKAPEEKEKNGAKVVTRGGLTMHCSICGKPDHNKKGHYKHVQKEQEVHHDDVQEEEVDENYDDPNILHNIIHQQPDPTMDPTHVVETMVYKMGHEVFFLNYL